MPYICAMTTPSSRPVVLDPGGGERVTVGASSLSIKAETATTGGAVFLSETEIEPGFPGPPPHTHERMHDMFYVLEGVLTVHVDGRTIEAQPGTFVCAPPGSVHTFANRSDAPVRFLNLATPAGFEGYMRELGAAFSGGSTPTSEEIGAIASRYDFRPAAPPGG
jgi:quercetin dioxygenase-like cupin family protein